MSVRRLLLDAGNTRLKWAVVERDRWLAHGAAHYDALSDAAIPFEPGMPCHAASVARGEDEALVRAWLAPHAIEPRCLSSVATFGEIENGYADPIQLGVDRWMALIAARQRTRSAVLVVSVGTALTVDALASDGRFLGGLIVPGLRLMRRALEHGTARLGTAPSDAGDRVAIPRGQVSAFPQTTADAVESGLVAALGGAVRTQYARLAEAAGMRPHCYVTGGDAACLVPHLGLPAEPIANLVLEGIEYVTRESESI